MGFSFRRSINFGPSRFNFSRSGAESYAGVKGPRLSMTPAGTTFVTVGSEGFYYREAPKSGKRPGRSQGDPASATDPRFRAKEEPITGASSSELVNSSSERLIQQLNQRARIFNPAWLLYVAAVLALGGLAVVPNVMHLPGLPEVTLPSAERSNNSDDEYSALTARYGEPDSILATEADPSVPIPVNTIAFGSVSLNVVFVPIGCVDQYSRLLVFQSDKETRPEVLMRWVKSIPLCSPPVDSGWSIVGYSDSLSGVALSGKEATARLDLLTRKEKTVPLLRFQGGPRQQTHNSPSQPDHVRPDMKSTEQSRVELQRLKQDIRNAETGAKVTTSASLTLASVFFVFGGYIHRRTSIRRQTNLIYELGPAEQARHNGIQESLDLLSKCNRIWTVNSTSENWDWKRDAGASGTVDRSDIRITTSTPPLVTTNIRVHSIDLGDGQLFFMPDLILYRDNRGYGSIDYSDFSVAEGSTTFIESEGAPADAQVIGNTWQYVNKDGSPDRRFNKNRQIPVLRLGVLVFTSASGLKLLLFTSNDQQSGAFADSWRRQFQSSKTSERPDQQYRPPPPKAEPLSNETSGARLVLGVDDRASGIEISAAYRKLAQMYHPDKVAGLAPEFQALADKRMKEINAAYELLKQKG